MDDIIKKEIGRRINSALAVKDVRQKDLAAALGVSDNTVSYFVSGSRTPNTEQIIKIAKHLNISTDYLLGLSDVMTTNADIKMISEYTALSEDTIEIMHLSSWNVTIKDFIDCLLKNSNSFLIYISMSRRCFEDFYFQARELLSDASQNSTEEIDDAELQRQEKARDDFDEQFKQSRLVYFETIERIKDLINSFLNRSSGEFESIYDAWEKVTQRCDENGVWVS